jgi:signal transduction histidine kinase
MYLQQEHDFLANAAHDLRTPLAAIRSTVEVALGGDRTESEYRELLGVVIEQCSALQTLINQLLLLAETDADRLRTDSEPVRLDKVIRQCCEMFEGVAEHHGVELRVAPLVPVSVAGNRHHLCQVVNNLLDNALKFTAARADHSSRSLDEERGAYVEVSLVPEEPHDMARLKVLDTGIGIGPEHLPNVFDRFYRADRARSRDAKSTGSGLGLAICKAFVEAHRGTISIKSSPGCGTVVTVTLPIISPTSALDQHSRYGR